MDLYYFYAISFLCEEQEISNQIIQLEECRRSVAQGWLLIIKCLDLMVMAILFERAYEIFREKNVTRESIQI